MFSADDKDRTHFFTLINKGCSKDSNVTYNTAGWLIHSAEIQSLNEITGTKGMIVIVGNWKTTAPGQYCFLWFLFFHMQKTKTNPINGFTYSKTSKNWGELSVLIRFLVIT